MKLTVAAVLAFTCASTLANSVPYGETDVYARDLYERGSGEGALGSFEKRRGHGGPSLSRSFAHAAGSFGGRLASDAAQSAIQQRLAPQPPQQRRSLGAGMRRRRVPNYAGAWRPVRTHGKGVATSFFNGFAQGVTSRGLEEDVLDELD